LPAGIERVLRGAGGVLLLWLAWSSLRDWRAGRQARPRGGRVPGTLLQAALVNLLNPNPYLGWTLVLGPLVLGAWQHSAAGAALVVAAFYLTIVAMLVLTILAFGLLRSFGERLTRALLLASAITLALLGVYQLTAAVR
jgi:threonine/homoserine/homoserine lactone efflux protein